MKKIILSFVFCFILISISKAQLTIDSLTTQQTIINDTVPLESNLNFSANVIYTSSTPFTGTIYLLCGVDSTGGLLSVDTVGSVNVVNFGLNDSVLINLSDSVSQQNGFRIGGNIVVVWPVADGLLTLDTFNTTIYVIPLLTSINENKALLNQFTIYPNPTQSNIFIKNNLTETKIKHVRIYGIRGELIFVSITTNNIDVSNLPKGTYFLKIELEKGEVFNYKVIKK